MGIQSLVLGHIISRSSRDHDPERASVHDDDPHVAKLGNDDGDDDGDEEEEEEHDFKDDARIDGKDLPGERDNNDIIHEIDFGSGPDPPVRRPRGYLFRRHLSLSGISTLSSIGPIINRRRSPPAWFIKLKSWFPRPDSESSSYIPNYRLTPIISGIVIPFSILLEIPGLTEHWYIRTMNNKTIESRPNPTILIIGQAFSIACAVMANACLVVRFMETRVKTMTLLCIALLTIHDIINIITVTIFGVEHRFNDGFTYGQPFWFTVCSTIASVFTNITLVVDLVRTPNFSRSGSGLTRKQRSLVIVVIILLCYIAFGALINSILIQLSFVDALYFSVVTIETIGFGDIVPHTTSARIFVCLYATVGILNVALMISLTRETVLETLEVSYRIRMRKLRQWRRVTTTRRRVEERWRVAIEWRLRENNARTWVKDAQTDTSISRLLSKVFDRVNWLWAKNGRHEYGHRYRYGLGYGFGSHPLGMHLNLEALTSAQLEAAALEAGVPLETLLPPNFKASTKAPGSPFEMLSGGGEGIPLTHARLGRMMTMLSRFALALHSSETASAPRPQSSGRGRESGKAVEAADEKGDESPSVDGLDTPQSEDNVAPAHIPITRRTSRRAHWQEYEAFRSKAEREERKAFYIRLSVAWILFIVFWTIGSAIFMVTEEWGYGVAMYFCFIAFTTIGYGDYHPETPAGRSIFVVWALLGVGTMTILISILSEAYSYRYKNAMHTHVFDKAVQHYRQTRIDKRASTPKPDPSELRNNTHVALSESKIRAQEQLEALPNEVLQTAGSFNELVSYFVRAHGSRGVTGRNGGGHGAAVTVPEGMRELLDDIARDEQITGRIKEEIMQDEDARRTLFRLSVEKTLRQVIDAAEQALDSVKQRNDLTMLHEKQTRNARRKGRHRENHSGSDSEAPPSSDFDGNSPASPSS